MDTKKIWAVALLILLVGSMATASLAVAAAFKLPPGNHSQHNEQVNEQRNETPAGAGIPGGTDERWPAFFPMPSPERRH